MRRMLLDGNIVIIILMFLNFMYGGTSNYHLRPRKKSADWIKQISKWNTYNPRRNRFMGSVLNLRTSMAEKFKKMKKSKETYYDPYYWGGERVFLKTFLPYNAPEMSPTVPVSTSPGTTVTINQIAMYRECFIICPEIYRSYGPICAQRLFTLNWTYYYKNFDDICELENENCYYEHARPTWHPLFVGHCRILDPSGNITTYRPYPDVDGVVSRRKVWVWETSTVPTKPPIASPPTVP